MIRRLTQALAVIAALGLTPAIAQNKPDYPLGAGDAIRIQVFQNPDLTLETLAQAFQPFMEFDLLSRDDKRKLLNVVMPQITVAKYEVKDMSLCLDTIRTDMAYQDTTTRLHFHLNLKAA